MGVQPNSRELLGHSVCIDLIFKELGDRNIVELHADGRGALFDGNEVFYKQQVVPGSDSKPADFAVTSMTKKLEFGPSEWIKPQRWRFKRLKKGFPSLSVCCVGLGRGFVRADCRFVG